MVFNGTFNTISGISRWSAVLVEETGENHISHIIASSTPRHERESNSQR
jgi:hypothetical protein